MWSSQILSPLTYDVDWIFIGRSEDVLEDVLDAFQTNYMRSVYVLCPWRREIAFCLSFFFLFCFSLGLLYLSFKYYAGGWLSTHSYCCILLVFWFVCFDWPFFLFHAIFLIYLKVYFSHYPFAIYILFSYFFYFTFYSRFITVCYIRMYIYSFFSFIFTTSI